MRGYRERNYRRSNSVLYYWNNFLSKYVNKLGIERLPVLEQVFIAALDSNQLDVANICLKYLSQEFPQSCRLKKLRAMKLESMGSFEGSLDLLDSICREDRTNTAPKKRIIAILKTQGKYGDAIKELTEYLKIFMADVEAWQELSDLYLTEHDYSKAAFCVEEMIIHNPHNHLVHQRYADIKYTIGGLENMELARCYYLKALTLNPHNLRALYGLHLTISNLVAASKTPISKRKDITKLGEWTVEKIKNIYSSSTSSDITHITSKIAEMSLHQ